MYLKRSLSRYVARLELYSIILRPSPINFITCRHCMPPLSPLTSIPIYPQPISINSFSPPNCSVRYRNSFSPSSRFSSHYKIVAIEKCKFTISFLSPQQQPSSSSPAIVVVISSFVRRHLRVSFPFSLLCLINS